MDIVKLFWDLPATERLSVVRRLGLLYKDDIILPEVKRYKLAFKRAGERGLAKILKDNILEISEKG